MWRSDWSRLACLARNLQILLRAIEQLLKITKCAVSICHVLNRRTLARLVACENKKNRNFQLMSKCCNLIGRHSPVLRAISKHFSWYSIASLNWPRLRFASPILQYALPSPALSPANTKISTDQKCCDLIGRLAPVCCAISKSFLKYSSASCTLPVCA